MMRTVMLAAAAVVAMSLPAEANGGYSRRAVVYREAPTTYVYERRAAPFISLGLGHSVAELYDSPPRLLVDLNPFHHHDALYLDPYIGGTLFGVEPFLGRRHFHRHHFHRGGGRHFRRR